MSAREVRTDSRLAALAAPLAGGLQDRVDGLCLLCLGGFMAALARSGLYWYFLNPRFSGLTLGAGALLCLCGLALLLRPAPGPRTPARLLRQAVLLAFLSLAASSWEQAASQPFPAAATPTLTAPAPLPAEEPAPDPHPLLEGERYTRLNLGELYIMLDKGRKDYPARFALRAQVLRTPELDARGHVLLRRVAVVCCLADSLDLRFLARAAANGLDGVRDGDWVEAYGSLEPLPAKAEGKALAALAPKGEGPGLVVTNPAFRVAVRRAQPVAQPAFPYLFEFNEQEPFAW